MHNPIKIVTFIIFLTITAACGTQDPQPEAAPNTENTENEEVSGETMGETFNAELQFNSDSDTPTLTFTVTNTADTQQTLSFNTAQRFDFIIKDADGNIVTKFSKGKMFAQMMGKEVLEPGDQLFYEAEVSELDPGTYTVEFWLTANEAKPKVIKEITID